MMMGLLLATGFTGALTCVFLVRLIHRHLSDAPSVVALFSPKGGCADAIVQQLGRAKKEVLILARSFASETLAKAVLDVKMRGVRVTVVLDRQNEKDPTSDLHRFSEQGLAPSLDTHFTCCHDNMILIDGRVVITGSFDFTRQADEENSDGLLILMGYADVMQACRKHFLDVKAHAQEYRCPGSPGKPADKPASKLKIAEAPSPAPADTESPAARIEKLSRRAA